LQFDNTASYSVSDWGGSHLFKGGIQFGQLKYESQYSVTGDHHVLYSNGVPTSVRQYNTPNVSKNEARVLGFFLQDSWTIKQRLTLNIGGRFDRYLGILPEQSNPAGVFAPARSVSRSEVIDQSIGVWRAGAAYDMLGNGRTALKASYSRYALQVGIDRVTNVNPLSAGSRTCPWGDANGDGRFQASEITGACSGFSGGLNRRYADDIAWPYSDEVTAGVEHQLLPDMRVGVMYYYRTNRDQFGERNLAVPTSAYTPFSMNVDAPTGQQTLTVYNLPASLASAQDIVRDNQPYLDTEYQGVEVTASKRFTSRWQMVAGFTVGRNEGGLNATDGQSSTADLNDPNTTTFDRGIIGNDSKFGFRLSGSYRLPYDINLSGSLVSNTGYPEVSTFQVTRAMAAAQGVAMTRASQTLPLTRRGDERLPSVTMFDLRIARSFRFGSRRFSPQLDIFNLGNASTIVNRNIAVGSTYGRPNEILSPRIIRFGFSLDF
jgi:hypothetical protein